MALKLAARSIGGSKRKTSTPRDSALLFGIASSLKSCIRMRLVSQLGRASARHKLRQRKVRARLIAKRVSRNVGSARNFSARRS